MAGAARFSLADVNEVLLGRGDRREARREVSYGYTTLHLHLPARSLSSRHARLVRAGGTWILEDAGSRNGSFLNGRRVVREVVRSDDVIDVGHVLLLVRESMDMRGTPPDLDGESLQGEPIGLRTIVPDLAHGFAAIRRLAPTTVPILFLGETGTGKELAIRAVHALSGRTGPIVPVNCGALTETLAEAQLFGHTKGAFSGATRDEPGFVRSASGGTLFLDEVGELPPRTQTTLLRVLQEGEVTPVGSTRTTKVDARIASATHRSLAEDRAFRPDLLARLAGFTFRLPPLRERIEDLGIALADILSAQTQGDDRVKVDPALGRLLLQYAWPLNLRELKQAVCAALALTDDGTLRLRHFPTLHAPERATAATVERPAAPAASDEDERLRVLVIARLREHRGNVRAVARAFGKAPMQIHRWLKRFQIDPNAFRGESEA
jgi:transcriptional regulator with GAF, ATPase, and Fis domain